MAKERPLSIPVILGFKGKGLDEAIRDTKRLSSQLGRLSDTAVKAAVGFAAFKGGQLVANFARDAIDAGRDLQVNMNGLQSVFGSATGEMVEFSKGMSSMGMSMAATAKASTFIGSVLKQSGFAMEEVTKQTQFLIKAAADLSLTFGYDVQEALLAITALFRGEYDPIEKFGVAMKQSEIESVKLERGLSKLTGSAERFADATIRLELFTERSGDSLGAYERQANTLRVAQDVLRASFQNLQQILGAAMLPAVRDLTIAIQPLLTAIGPVLATAIQSLIPLINSLAQNNEQVIRTFVGFIKAIAVATAVMAQIAKHIVENIDGYILLAKTIAIVATGLYSLRIGVAIMNTLRDATMAFNIAANLSAVALKRIKYGLVAIPVVGWALGLIGLATDFYGLTSSAEDATKSIDEMFDIEELMQAGAGISSVDAATAGLNDTLAETAGAAGTATDAVGDFYKKLLDEVEKQQAKLELEGFGASPALINAILGSGEQWREVFNSVVASGLDSVRAVQQLFAATTSGYEEAMAEWETNVLEPFKEFQKEAESARDSFVEFLGEFDVLPSIETTLGQFEASAVSLLESIEEKLADAFDNGHLLQSSYDNLLAYARDELNVLRDIERQRDQLLARRDAALQLIDSVNKSVVASGDITRLLRDVQNETDKIDVVEFARHTLEAGGDLREFKTALISNFIDPIEEAAGKSEKLVNGFRGVVARTREYVENLKALRALGLDPMLFNQLVQAGVEAGAETAQALIDGGSETINEVNGLFGELNSLGAELGEETAQVMYGQGALFVDGIVAGLESQLAELETMADSLASSFTTTFEQVLVQGIEDAIEAAHEALENMPSLPGGPSITPGGGGGGGGGGAGGGGSAGGTNVPPPLLPSLINQAAAANAAAAAAAAADAAEANRIGQIVNLPRPSRFPIAGTTTPLPSQTYVNIYTASSGRSVANALTRFNTTNPTQNQSATNSRSLKSGG